jgi:hypothetical protein
MDCGKIHRIRKRESSAYPKQRQRTSRWIRELMEHGQISLGDLSRQALARPRWTWMIATMAWFEMSAGEREEHVKRASLQQV